MQILTEPSFQTNFFHHRHTEEDTYLLVDDVDDSNGVRFVRFLLSPPPEEKMKTRSSSQSQSQSQGKKIVLPDAPKEEEWKFGSANTWDREHLESLGVSFWRKKLLNLDSVLKVNESDWTKEMKDSKSYIFIFDRIGVAMGVEQLSSVEVRDLETRKINMDDLTIDYAPQFASTFSTLVEVRSIEEKKKRAKDEKKAREALSQTSSTILQSSQRTKHPPPSPISTQPSKRSRTTEQETTTRVPSPKTPDRPTVPSDPDLTHGTVESGVSIQSKDEESTKVLANTLIRDTMNLLGSAFRAIRWQTSGNKVQLTRTYIFLQVVLTSL
jgi:hypothetical protein